MIIKKIFEGIFDEEVHADFLKFGKGKFTNKYLLEAKKQPGKWLIKAGPEFANYFVRENLGKLAGKIFVKGIIVTTNDLETGFEIKKRSNFQGIKKLEIETEVDVVVLKNLIEKFPRVFFALSFSGQNFELKIKPKSPKSAKPGKENEEGPKADFCTLKTSDEKIVKDLFFDHPHFKEISVNHTLEINEIVYPVGFANMRPEEVREKSKRKGKITRKVIVDGKEEISEKEFVA